MASLLDEALKALKKEEDEIALSTGRGTHGTDSLVIAKRVGIAMGIAKAQDILRETAKRVAKEDDA